MDTTTRVLSKEEILNRPDVMVEQVDIPEWDGVCYIRVMTSGERDCLTKTHGFEETDPSPAQMNARLNFRARFASVVLSDAEGCRLFDEGDVLTLNSRNGRAIERILSAGVKLNGWGEKEIEEIEKNSEPAQSDDSGSR